MSDFSFAKKIIETRLTLRAGDFGGRGNTKIVRGLPTKVKIEKTGPPDLNKATVEIHGMKLEDMERLSTLSFKPLATAKNLIEIRVGDECDNDLSTAFIGEITTAAADFNGAPEVWMKFECVTGYYGSVTAIGPSAIKGSQTASSFIETKAKQMGYAFKNEGVSSSLNNAIFNGSPMEQMRSAARQVGAEILVDDTTVTLTPFGGPKKTGNAVLLNKSTGMLGYPVITSEGVVVKALYNPAFQLGSFVKVESIVPKASGVWRIIKLTHDLQAYCTDGGPWESEITGFPPNETPSKSSKSK